MSNKNNILLIHTYGQSTFKREDVLAFGSLENLIASDTLAGIPNREKSLSELWEAAHIEIPEAEPMEEAESESPEETTEKEE